MILWCRFNRLFHSESFGLFLYNALSNTLIELDEVHYNVLERFRESRVGFDTGSDSVFIALLRECKILLDEGEESHLLLSRQYRRQTVCFDSSRLGLTICPTLGCNFRCPYCFEHSQQNSAVMTPETVDRLISFIKSYQNVRHLSIAWYGGEPLLAFEVIGDFMEKINDLDLVFEGSGLITNGYLLDSEKISRLNNLRINSVQITLDGPEEVHDTRRFLSGGGPTFQRIMKNIDTLMNSSYEGVCTIRVNIDKHNLDQFIALRSALMERFRGKKLSVYAGQVNTGSGHSYDGTCNLDMMAWKDFNLDMRRRIGQPTGGLLSRRKPGQHMYSQHAQRFCGWSRRRALQVLGRCRQAGNGYRKHFPGRSC